MKFLEQCAPTILLQIFKRKLKPRYLPDEIIVEILSRLPYKHVHRCRVVCKLWLALTSSSHFVHLHLKRSVPLPRLLAQTVPRSGWKTTGTMDLFMLGEEVSTPNRSSSVTVKRICDSVFKLRLGENLILNVSGYGLVVFRHMCGSRYEVWNLLTRERVTVKVPPELLLAEEDYNCEYSRVSAIFVHPRTKEYRMLLACPALQGDESVVFHFLTYSLNTKLWRKLPQSCCLTYPPQCVGNPVVLHGGATLHWMADSCHQTSDDVIAPCTSSIIIFDTQTEELRLMPHPGNECPSRFLHRRMCISETREGLLSFYSMVTPAVVNIYVLEDYNNWSWTKRHSIDLSHAFSNKSRDTLCSLRSHNYKLLVQFEEKLCLVDLEDEKKSIKVIDETTIMGDLKPLIVVSLSYAESTVSLYQMNSDLLI